MPNVNPYRHHSKRLLSLGLPLVGGHLAGFAIHMSDTIMLGWYSVEALAAGVLGSTFFFVLFIFLSGFGQAVMPVVASAEASGETRQVRRVTRMAMWLSILTGLAALPLFIYSSAILERLGQPDVVAALAAEYLTIAGLGLIPALLVQVFRSYLSALERTQVVLWVTVAALIVNILVNYALIFGNWGAPELGVRGAAIASVIVQVVSIIGVAIYSAIVTSEHELFVRFWRPDWEAFGSIFSLGWPIGLTALSEVGLFAASSVMMGWLGTLPLAAHGIAIQIASIFFLVHMGLANAATIRVGQAAGRKDVDAVKQVIISANGLSAVFAVVSIMIYVTFGAQMIGVFLDPSEPSRAEVIQIGTVLLMVAALFQLADAGQVQALSHLRGLQDTRVPMLMAAFSYWVVGMPTSYVLGFVLNGGGVGIWTGLTIGLLCAWALMGTRLYRMVFSPVHRVIG
jgi:MATE family multidrug resistance protein